jgi:hypothetical protein
VINPDLVKKERLALHVETQEGDRYGQTFEVQEGPKIDVCMGVDGKAFLELFLLAFG